MNEFKEMDMTPEDPFAGLESVTQEDLSKLEGAEKSGGLSYDHYVSLPKLAVVPLVKLLDILTKIAADDFARNIHICCEGSNVVFRWNNDQYMLQYRVENLSGKTISPYAIPIQHLKSLLGSVIANLNLVEQEGALHACFGRNLVYVATVPFKEEWYSFDLRSDDPMEKLDSGYLRGHLRSFTSLFSQTEKASEKILICKDDTSYIMAGAVMGKTKSFLGNNTVILSRPIIECLCTMLEGNSEDLSVSFVHPDPEEKTKRFSEALLTLGDRISFVFPVQANERVDNFLSPMFRDSFKYDASVQIVNESFVQLLNVINTLDYFTPVVQLEFMGDEFVMTAHRKDSQDASYSFKYMSGTSSHGIVNVEISTLLLLLAKSGPETKYAVGNKSLIIDTGVEIFCLRSIELA